MGSAGGGIRTGAMGNPATVQAMQSTPRRTYTEGVGGIPQDKTLATDTLVSQGEALVAARPLDV